MTVQSVGGGFPKSRSAAWLAPLVPVAIASLALSALVYYHVCGNGLGDSASALQLLIVGIYRSVGFVPSFLFFLLALTWGSIWFLTGRIQDPAKRLLHLLGLTLVLAIWVNLQPGEGPVPLGRGTIGAWIAGRMLPLFGHLLSTLLVAPVALATLVLATDFFFYRYFEELGTGHKRADAGPSLAGELGVETAVPEEFKGLAERTRDLVPAPAASGSSAGDVVSAEAAASEPSTAWRTMRAERAALSDSTERWAARRAAEDAASLAAFEADLAEDETGSEPEPADDEAPAVVIGPPPRTAPEQAEEEAATIIDATEAAETEEAEEAEERADAQPMAIDEDEDEQEEDERGGDGPEVITPPPRPGSRTVAEPEAQGVSLDEQWSLDLQETESAGEGADPRAAHEDAGEDETAEPEVVEERDEEEEPTVTIPRPAEPVRQRRLFRDPSIDEGLVREATDLVLESGRANAAHLQRRLRIDYEQAVELLGILAQRGVIHLEAGANQGRLLGDGSGTPVS
jgi:hypothetical protein